MGRDTIQLENAVSTISQEYLLGFTSEYGIPESLHLEFPGLEDPIVEFLEGKVGVYRWMSFSERPGKNTPQCYTKPLDSLKNWNNRFFGVNDRVFPTVADWRTSAPKDQMPPVGSYSATDLDQCSHSCQSENETRPRAAHEVPLLTTTANRVIDMEDMTGASGSSRTPFTVEKSPLDFSNEDPSPLITKSIRAEEQGKDEFSQGAAPVGNPSYTGVAPEQDLEKETVDTGSLVSKRHCKRGPDEAEVNAPPKVLRKDYVASHPSPPTEYPRGEINGFHRNRDGYHCFRTCDTRDSRSYEGRESSKKVVVMKDPDSKKSISFTSMVGSPGSIYQPGWGVTNNCRLDTPAACQDMVDHKVAPGLRFEQETKLLKKTVAQVARRDQRIEVREKHIRNLEALLEAEVDMKGAAEAKNVELAKELESLRAQIMGEERIKAAFEEFKKYEDDRLSSRCAEIDARLDAL
uniref:Transposase (Putative), gypsy type n=1 Tax=Tanacetum cinerariifolium TaxID=118510 RepID=A0A699H9N8_TANCI|nr:hypothetical protein [Tanacetum cinerariifolium]